MYEIAVTDRQLSIALDVDRIRRVAARTLEEELVASAQISLVFVDDHEIQRINRDFLQHDYPTDVISFLLNCRQTADGENPAAPAPRGQGKTIEGEVIVSTETAVAAARDFVWSPEEETLLYVVHGLLHLAGYDDLSEDERQIMRTRERDVLSIWGLTPEIRDPEEDVPLRRDNRAPSSSVDGESP